MKALHYDKEIVQKLEGNPLTIGSSPCDRCGSRTTLVNTSTGKGFVKRYCPECDGCLSLTDKEFLNSSAVIFKCPACEREMEKQLRVFHHNYGFVCKICELGVELSVLLPDRFNYRAL